MTLKWSLLWWYLVCCGLVKESFSSSGFASWCKIYWLYRDRPIKIVSSKCCVFQDVTSCEWSSYVFFPDQSGLNFQLPSGYLSLTLRSFRALSDSAKFGSSHFLGLIVPLERGTSTHWVGLDPSILIVSLVVALCMLNVMYMDFASGIKLGRWHPGLHKSMLRFDVCFLRQMVSRTRRIDCVFCSAKWLIGLDTGFDDK